MTTENVTVLFTDLVGSTALSSSLAHDEADRLRREHFSVLRQAVAESGGTEVKNLGDGLMVVFGAASAALACAVLMQQGVERDSRDRDAALGLRVGVSGGEVTREDDDYFGDPVVEAARLCAQCEGGQILAADVVRLMAGRRNPHVCRPLGPLALKGLPDEIETVEVVWEPIAPAVSGPSGSVPLPGRLAYRPTVGVVGRAEESSTLADAFKRVADGGGREAVLVSGEAGLGKTTLVAEAARAAFDQNAIVLFGHCAEDLATPYQLFAEALAHYVTHAPEEALRRHGPDLARLVPAVRARIPDLPPSAATDSDTERFLLLAAVVGLLTEVSREQPIVLVLDDLHWADNASLSMLRHLLAADPAMRVLVVGTYRDNELSNADALVETLAALHREQGVTRLDLAGLDDTGVVAFLEAAAGQELDEAGVGLAHAVYRETDGNPFFVAEVLRHLSETGAIYQDDGGRWTGDLELEQLGLPESVRAVIGARVVRLGEDAGRVLSMAAVIGRDFDVDLLADATGTSVDDVLDVLDAADAAALVREAPGAPGCYSFTHALIQHTLYDDLSATRRARAHRVVAEAMEELGGTSGARIGELARHWMAASRPADELKAIEYSRQAGDAALAALAPADALRYYAQALELYPADTDPDPCLALDLAIGLGTAQRQTGDPAFRETLLAAARTADALGDTDRLVQAALANNRGMYSAAGNTDEEKVAVLELALERIASDHPDRALLLASLCGEFAMGTPLERRRALADEAIAIAAATADDALIVRVSNLVTPPLYVPALQEEGLARTADALLRAERLGDPVLLHWAAHFRFAIVSNAGEVDEAARCFEIVQRLALQLDQPFMQWWAGLNRAYLALVAGEPDQAEERANEDLTIGIDGGQPDALIMFGTQFALVNLQRGTFGDLAPSIAETMHNAPEISTEAVAGSLAAAHAEADRLDLAAQVLREYLVDGPDLPMDQAWMTITMLHAHAAVEVGNPEIARIVFEALAPFHDQVCSSGGMSPHGPVSHYLGGLATVLADYDAAERYFTHAAAVNQRLGAKFFNARNDLLWGRMLVQRSAPSDLDRARELLTSACTVAAEHGYANVERWARADLDALP
jgi:class 3 adenylate cyclase/tetratricopeptide (TPR) repeat protein